MKQRQNEGQKLVVAKGEEGGRGLHWDFEISGCKLVYRGWINNRVLLCSMGSYIQYPVVNHNGKGYEIGCVSMYGAGLAVGSPELSLLSLPSRPEPLQTPGLGSCAARARAR